MLMQFPEFERNDWFLTGESYAGVYVPMLVRSLLERGSDISKSLKGFAVGDACAGSDVLCGAGRSFFKKILLVFNLEC